MADVKTLEHSTLKVPYELLNKQFRASQKVIDREISKISNVAADLEKKMENSPALTVGDVTCVLSNMVDSFSVLKRKADESIHEELGVTRVIKRRLAHLQEREAAGIKDGVPPTLWQKNRLDRMLVEYFLRAGYYHSALKLAKHSDIELSLAVWFRSHKSKNRPFSYIEDLTNIDLFMMSKDIEDSLAKSDAKPCLNWCLDNRSKLRKMKSTLEFNIRKQEFVALVLDDKRIDAVKHARKYFSSAEPSQVNEVQKLMGMLAFKCGSTGNPYSELLSVDNWQNLVLQFRQENFKLHQLNTNTAFTVTLQAGLSALKTLHCYKDDPSLRNSDCPVCSTHMNELAQPLPFAHCANSKLVCSITGFALNEHNPPVMLPNGRIYGLKALESMADVDGKVVCPRTNQVFRVDDLEKVFVM